jgi:hypothetical protein
MTPVTNQSGFMPSSHQSPGELQSQYRPRPSLPPGEAAVFIPHSSAFFQMSSVLASPYPSRRAVDPRLAARILALRATGSASLLHPRPPIGLSPVGPPLVGGSGEGESTYDTEDFLAKFVDRGDAGRSPQTVGPLLPLRLVASPPAEFPVSKPSSPKVMACIVEEIISASGQDPWYRVRWVGSNELSCEPARKVITSNSKHIITFNSMWFSFDEARFYIFTCTLLGF